MSRRFTKELQDFVFEHVSKMKTSTLENQARAINTITNSNCCWLEYELAPVIKGVIENELKLRQAKLRQNLPIDKSK